MTDTTPTEIAPSDPPPSPLAEPHVEPTPPRGLSRNGAILIGATLVSGLGLVFAPARIVSFVFVVCGWLLSVAIHEFCHAITAYRGGDKTVADKGYLTLDPLKYTNRANLIIPLLALAVGGIGLPGGAVYVNNGLIRSRAARAFTALAGPLGTLLCFVTLLIVLQLSIGVHAYALARAVAFLAFLQVTALVLNLLPIPGLDGFGVLRPFLPKGLTPLLNKIGGVMLLVLFLLIFWVPDASTALFGAALSITDLAGIPRQGILSGWRDFEFWKGLSL